MELHRAIRLRAARAQTAVVIAVVAAVGVLCVTAGLAARDPDLTSRVECARREHCREIGGSYNNHGYFRDRGEWLLLDELPAADYSKGGVYLFGASNLAWATQFWALPPDQKSRIHNYGVVGTDHPIQFQLLRFLVERQKLLQAGGDKNLVILGVSYNILHDGYDYFGQLLKRQGLYRYSRDGEIQAVPVHPAYRFALVEQERIAGMLREFLIDWPRRLRDRWRTTRLPREDCESYKEAMRQRVGPEWESKMKAQTTEFGRMLDYLRIRNVAVIVVLMPLSSCDGELPYEQFYKQGVSGLCRAKEVRLLDWSALLDDEDFRDHVHANVDGTEKLHRAFMNLALPFLDANRAAE